MSGYVRKRHIKTKEKANPVNAGEFKAKLEKALKRRTGGATVEILGEPLLKRGTPLKLPVAICAFRLNNSTNKCVVAWAGTDVSKRPMDLLTDLSATPAACLLWLEMCPRIQAHSAMMAHVQGDFAMYNKVVQNIMIDNNCTELIFTGHSLGGGCAQLAHMMTLGQVEAKVLSDEKLAGVSVRSIVFAAPMVFYEVHEDSEDVQNLENPEEIDKMENTVKQIFQATSTNFICGHDVVPRLPGLPEFVRPAFREIFRTLGTSAVMKILGGSHIDDPAALFGGAVDKLCDLLISKGVLEETYEALKSFKHFSMIQYVSYKPDASEKIVTETLTPDEFQKIEYTSTEDRLAYNYYFLCHSWFPQKIFFRSKK